MSWDSYFIGLLEHVASKSKHPRAKVGAIFVGNVNDILITGFNGIPIGVDDSPLEEKEDNRYSEELGTYYCEHAERNAIYLAARRGRALEHSTVYTSQPPCHWCARGIIQVGCKLVVYDYDNWSTKVKERTKNNYLKSIQHANTMLREARVEIYPYSLLRNTKM